MGCMPRVVDQCAVSTAVTHTFSRLAPINGLRGFAIIGVIYFHLIAGSWSTADVSPWLSPLLTNTWTGVNLFFILSGFVLFLPLAVDPDAMRLPADRMYFYRRRAWRLLPLFYVAVLSQWGIAALGGKSGLDELLRVTSFLFVLSPNDFFPTFNGPLWSIGVEVAFSAVFPSLVLAFLRLGIARLVFIVAVVSLGMRLVGYVRAPAAEVVAFNTDMFLCRVDEFVLGMALARLYVDRRLPSAAGRCLLAGIALVLMSWLGFDLTARHFLPSPVRAGLNDVMDAGFCLIVAAALAPGSRFAMALSWRPLQVAGMMCYSLYIWHWPLLHWIISMSPSLTGSYIAHVTIYLVVTLIIAGFSYRFIEFGQVPAWRLFLLDPPIKPRSFWTLYFSNAIPSASHAGVDSSAQTSKKGRALIGRSAVSRRTLLLPVHPTIWRRRRCREDASAS